MTILLYDNCELEERASKHLKAWKAWHLVLYIFAAVFGIMNFVFLQNTMAMVDDHCVLFPRDLEFRTIEVVVHNDMNTTDAQPTVAGHNETIENGTEKREAVYDETMNSNASIDIDDNATTYNENKTHRLVLDTSRSLFEDDSDCMFAEYMPVMSTVFATVWTTMFTMCAGGGRVRSGLLQPWRILAPALLFALVMVGLTGHSFTITNGGLHAFCAEFYNHTNTTTCSSVNPLLERSWNTSWGFGSRAMAARGASAGVWASWACVAALLLARCLAAPDFQVRRTTVYLARDPQQKITSHLKKSRSGQRQRSIPNSPSKRDTVSVRSEPTVTTELVSASVDNELDSAPSSVLATPAHMRLPADAGDMNTENIRMMHMPHESRDNL